MSQESRYRVEPVTDPADPHQIIGWQVWNPTDPITPVIPDRAEAERLCAAFQALAGRVTDILRRW